MIDRTLLITGASSGVGKSLAHHFRSTFDHIILAARRIEILQEVFGGDPKYSLYQVDLAAQRETIRFAEEVSNTHGFIPYVINNAATNSSSRISEIRSDDFQRSLNVNALSPLLILQSLLPMMRKNNFGRVVNVTSGAPLNLAPGSAMYGGSKALLNALTVVIAAEERDSNIKVNLMSPGPVKTEMAPHATMSPDASHPTMDFLLNLRADGPTGCFFWLGYEIPLFPDLTGTDWQSGTPGPSLRPAF